MFLSLGLGSPTSAGSVPWLEDCTSLGSEEADEAEDLGGRSADEEDGAGPWLVGPVDADVVAWPALSAVDVSVVVD